MCDLKILSIFTTRPPYFPPTPDECSPTDRSLLFSQGTESAAYCTDASLCPTDQAFSTHIGFNFGELPLELQVLVCEKLADSSIASLRRSCRHLYQTLSAYHYHRNVRQHRSSALPCLALHGCLDQIQLMAQLDSLNTRARDTDGRSVLHCAVQSGDVQVVDYLLRILTGSRSGINLRHKESNHTPLSVAAENGCLPIVERLLKVRGIQVNGRKRKDPHWGKPLLLAAENGFADIVKRLIERRGDVHARDNNGRTPLALAAAGGHRETIKVLLNGGAEQRADDKDGHTPFLLAALFRRKDAIALLMPSKADGRRQYDLGTALTLAVSQKFAAGSTLLLSEGADPATAQYMGESVLTYAATWDNEAILTRLVRNIHDPQRFTKPLQAAAENGNLTAIKLFMTKAKGSVGYGSRYGNRTPLWYAARHGHFDVVQYLLDNDNIDLTSHTDCIRAAAYGNHKSIILLLAKAIAKHNRNDGA